MSTPDWEKKWPQKIREDWVNKFEEFADWAEKSGRIQSTLIGRKAAVTSE